VITRQAEIGLGCCTWEGRVFFFEKKNQKTFDYLAPSLGRLRAKVAKVFSSFFQKRRPCLLDEVRKSPASGAGGRIMPGMTHAILELFQSRVESPIGGILLLTDDRDRLRALDFVDHCRRREQHLDRHYGVAGWRVREAGGKAAAAEAIGRYFDGDMDALGGIATQCGGTEFQRSVWSALRTIEAGATRSYAAIARQVGRAAAIRAVGAANGANPIGIVVPCHRVIGANGALTGFGGGIERKSWLLAHEARHRRT
jgi:methylated-DNA-[protein]-cysteine S-methyltransferase